MENEVIGCITIKEEGKDRLSVEVPKALMDDNENIEKSLRDYFKEQMIFNAKSSMMAGRKISLWIITAIMAIIVANIHIGLRIAFATAFIFISMAYIGATFFFNAIPAKLAKMQFVSTAVAVLFFVFGCINIEKQMVLMASPSLIFFLYPFLGILAAIFAMGAYSEALDYGAAALTFQSLATKKYCFKTGDSDNE
ncbi:MAG: hypothetical protein K6G10_06765 [Butyrivibrio sp.]|nr:hypothetical protein [Butyrivibrio sp.]